MRGVSQAALILELCIAASILFDDRHKHGKGVMSTFAS